MGYKFYMSEEDIKKSYREARFPETQVTVLAELNLVPVKVMREFLLKFFDDVPKTSSGRKKGRKSDGAELSSGCLA
jgi:hypothetical protein